MTARTKAIMVVIPSQFLLNMSLTLDVQFPEWFYLGLCYEQYNSMFWRSYFGFTSFLISLMRYMFIVYNQQIMKIGKATVKNVFYVLSIGLPAIMTVLHACALPVPPSAHNTAHRTCHKFLQKTYNMTCGDDEGVKDDCTPILTFILDYVPSDITHLIGVTVKVLYIIMCANVIEGILYWKTFKTIRE